MVVQHRVALAGQVQAPPLRPTGCRSWPARCPATRSRSCSSASRSVTAVAVEPLLELPLDRVADARRPRSAPRSRSRRPDPRPHGDAAAAAATSPRGCPRPCRDGARASRSSPFSGARSRQRTIDWCRSWGRPNHRPRRSGSVHSADSRLDPSSAPGWTATPRRATAAGNISGSSALIQMRARSEPSTNVTSRFLSVTGAP